MEFFLYILLYLFIIGTTFVALLLYLNIYLNEFGLFTKKNKKEHRVYINERRSKYLFSFNYIPKNFDGILVGPSLSAIEMNTKDIQNNKIYNLSINGANISEQKLLIDNILKYGNIKTFIICLDPYLFMDSGMKTTSINEKEYFDAKYNPVFIFKYFKRRLKGIIENNKRDTIYENSYWGYRHNDPLEENHTSTLMMDKFISSISKRNYYPSDIDIIAYKELEQILLDIRAYDIKIIAYYFPRPKRVFEAMYDQKSYQRYKEQIDKLLNYKSDIIINFEDESYNYFSEDDTNYYDTGHLSIKGGKKLISILNNKIN